MTEWDDLFAEIDSMNDLASELLDRAMERWAAAVAALEIVPDYVPEEWL